MSHRVGCACGDVIAREEVLGLIRPMRRNRSRRFGVGAIAGRPPAFAVLVGRQIGASSACDHPDLDIAGQVGRFSIVQRKAAIASGKRQVASSVYRPAKDVP